ncbi:hypothetical protein ACKKBG_A00255 [Auxenochlorella protothecoides x Auxenochlorella symbiontica]|uniref:DNA replication complex GINS protein SLD5 n=1 Tax=Auxenochlorella protothecoides TaxID=3075 RepID=A0A087SP47_AUXPR|nr:DNA replication complex GINS protein SLD5 [Auxenochlorella protothecoides]KFM27501.1 DNA replication complex GINS protein SLD5 [Auxenochlorella protothecoides]RMZ54597.1 hypothetical protein APUTEX25_002183 [Auxenochlorella protothecoides]|eukprot:RMZ54597.1 hypothetical protein APUTEX25_002183 [Auxenochlorella protothecoides]
MDAFPEATPGTSGRSDQEALKIALINEKSSPEILMFQEDLVSRIEAQIDYQEEQIELMRGNQDLELLRTIFTTELARVRYLLRCYYRVRLHKIEEYAMHILDTAEVKERLSDREDAHAQEFFMLQGTHLKMAVGRQLPEAFSSLVRQAAAHPEKDMVPRPDLDKHVFCRVLEDRGQVPVDDAGNTAQFNKDDVFVIRYQPLQPLLAEGSVCLL